MEIKLRPWALALMAGTALSACGTKAQKKQDNDPVKVTLVSISGDRQPEMLRYSGDIEPDNTAQIGFAVPGVVNQVLVEEGQHVKQGQLLAGIDATEYVNALAIANAGLEQAEDMYHRLDGLYKKGSLPEKDYIDIKTKLAQARANKSINAKRIGDSKLYAPMSGIVSVKSIERGSTAAPGVPAFTIVKTDQVYTRISVPESEVGALSPGMPASVYVPTLKDTFRGKVTIINPQADAASKTFTVKIQLANPAGKLLPGMIAETRISTGRLSDMLTIPAGAILRDADGITYVYITNGKDRAIRRRVTLGSVTGSQEVMVTAGLSSGDKVVTSGHTRLKDGAAIRF